MTFFVKFQIDTKSIIIKVYMPVILGHIFLN